MADAKKKILIVEDEVALLNVLATKFAGENFEIFKAKNGEEGLIEAEKNRPDIILLDIIMPKMDGITMLKKLRETPFGRNVKVIILSNLSESAAVEESIKNGAFDYLIKTNWNLDAVVDKVKKSINL